LNTVDIKAGVNCFVVKCHLNGRIISDSGIFMHRPQQHNNKHH